MTNPLIQLGEKAKKAARFLAIAETTAKNKALEEIISGLKADEELILTANKKDIKQARENNLPESMIDRLLLTSERLTDMCRDIQTIINLDDPIGLVDKMWKNEAGLTIGKQRVPLGVIGMIYEARPNVTTDAATLCFKSGNAVILRGGKEAFHSNLALVTSMQKSLTTANFPKEAIQLVEDTSRETARAFMQLNGYLDVLIPRGGANLIKTVVETASVPVIETGSGNCHIYVDKDADLEMAVNITINGKCQRPSVCNSTETVIVHEDILPSFLPIMEQALKEYQVELRADEKA
ncbi:MAG: glutamate-5-semialdehyde dehydrogenase, partial [Vagococcus fluvialis]